MADQIDLDDIGDHVHCDDYAQDPNANPAARKYIEHARSPGHGMMQPKPWPKLFATYEGERVRVVVASRLGDLGISRNLEAEHGYDRRVFVDQLANMADVPWSTRVVHCKRAPFDVYIGRPSKWGNPFTFKAGTIAEFVVPMDEVIPRYEAWLVAQPELMAALPELRGKVLGCWCAPKACHGDVLARLAELAL